MDATFDPVRTYLAAHHGALGAAAARAELGLTSADLARLTDLGLLEHVCRGGYADRAALEAASPERAHELRTRAVLATNPRFVASHQSGATMLGFALLATDLGRVHVIRTGAGHGRVRPAYTVHEGRPLGTGTLDGAAIVSPLDAVVGSMCLASDLTAQGLADEALRRELATRQELRDAAVHYRGGPRVRRAIDGADPLAESLGESGMRMVLRLLGYAVQTQVEIRDDQGLVGRVDAYLPELRVVVEFDGAVKYAGADGRDALMREKRREDRLRALGLGVVRLVWADLAHPERVRRAVEQAARVASR